MHERFVDVDVDVDVDVVDVDVVVVVVVVVDVDVDVDVDIDVVAVAVVITLRQIHYPSVTNIPINVSCFSIDLNILPKFIRESLNIVNKICCFKK